VRTQLLATGMPFELVVLLIFTQFGDKEGTGTHLSDGKGAGTGCERWRCRQQRSESAKWERGARGAIVESEMRNVSVFVYDNYPGFTSLETMLKCDRHAAETDCQAKGITAATCITRGCIDGTCSGNAWYGDGRGGTSTDLLTYIHMRNHPWRTLDPQAADVFYVPTFMVSATSTCPKVVTDSQGAFADYHSAPNSTIVLRALTPSPAAATPTSSYCRTSAQ
jgi:hypothetical protein